MIWLAWISLVLMNGLIAADWLLTEFGTRRGLAQEGNSQWRAADGSFRALFNLLVYLPIVAALTFFTVFLLLHPQYGRTPLSILIAGNSALGVKHAIVVYQWSRLFWRSA